MDTGHFPSESDLLSLIQHVYETDANNESYALEWKSALVFKGDVNGHEDFPVGGQVVSLWAVG